MGSVLGAWAGVLYWGSGVVFGLVGWLVGWLWCASHVLSFFKKKGGVVKSMEKG